MLVKFIEDKKQDWEDYLDQCLFAYNTARQESTRFTPFELMYARRAVLPIDLQSDKDSAEDVLKKCLPLLKDGKIKIFDAILVVKFEVGKCANSNEAGYKAGYMTNIVTVNFLCP